MHTSCLNWGDWFKDEALSQCREGTRGIWVDAIGRMETGNTDRVTGQLCRLPAVLRANMENILLAAIELAETGTADVYINETPVLEWRQENARKAISEVSIMANGLANARLTIVCRRLSRELEIRKLRSQAGKIGAENRWHKPNQSDGNTQEREIGAGHKSEIEPALVPSEAWPEIREMVGKVLEAYGLDPAMPDGLKMRSLLQSNLAELYLTGVRAETLKGVLQWARSPKARFVPKDPLSLTDPVKFAKWQTMEQEQYRERTKLR